MQNFTEKHYRPFLQNGIKCKKWSGKLPVNYGNEKSRPKGKSKGIDIYSTDTTQGCTGQCVGCYAARLCVISSKNFGWVKNVSLTGKPSGKAFLWTRCPNRMPDGIINSNIGFNITLDPMRDISFINKALRDIKRIGPDRVVICFRVYPGNEISKARCLAIASFLRRQGYQKFIHVIVRLFSKEQAKQTGSALCPKDKNARKLFYQAYKVKGLGLTCGSLGSGKCSDCLYCYKVHKAKYRIGTSADPLDRPEHTEKELIRKGFINNNS